MLIKILAEAIGCIAIIESFWIYYSKTRDRILIFKSIYDALWLVNLTLLGGYTGALLNLIAMGRETVFYHRDKKKWASSPLWLVFFLVVTAISPMVSLLSGKEGWYALLPALGSISAVIGFYQRRPAVTRYIGFVAQSLWLIYSIFIHSYSSVVSNAVLLISALAGTLRDRLQKSKEPMF